MKFTAPALITFALSKVAMAQATPAVAPQPPAIDPDAESTSAPAAATTQAPVVAASADIRYETDGTTLFLVRDLTRTPVSLPEPARTATYHDGSLYITHGNTTVSVYSCQDPEHPAFARSLTTGHGVAIGVEVVGGKVWVVSVSQQAVPADELVTGLATGDNASAPQNPNPTPVAVPAAPAVPALGHAVKVVEPGTIEVAAGRQHHVRVGDRFAIYRETALGGGDSGFSGEELVAFAEVVAVKDESALAELSRTAVVNDSDVARVARTDQNESNAYPVRVAHVGEFGGTIRPLINAGSPLGFGVLADVQGSYWGNGYFVNLMVQPLGLGWTDAGNVVSTSALIEGGFDGRAFSVGLGVGVSAVNGDVESMLDSTSLSGANADRDTTQVTERQATHSAFALSQVVRLGARDGVHLSLRNLLILQDGNAENDSGFIYGGTMGKLTVPLDRRNDLFLEGGGGVMGYWMFGAGVGTWVVGNGSPGSWKLSISAGAAGIWGTKQVTTTTANSSWVSNETVDLAGPMVAFGVTRRFGL